MDLSSKSEVLAYMRQARYAVIATIGADGRPESALMGVATTNELEIVDQFSILVLSETDGAVIREAAPPKQ